MKKLTKLLSMILAFVLLFNFISQPVLAAEYNKINIKQNFISSIENANAKEVFDELSPTAQQILLEYLIYENNQLFDYHKQFVGNIDINLNKTPLQQSYSSNEMYATSSAVLNTLNSNLNALNLGSDVVYALMSAASAMLAQGASLGATTIFTILVTAGCTAVIVANWSTVSPKFNGIIAAFQKSFDMVYASALSSGFGDAKTSYGEHHSNMTNAEYLVKGAYMVTSTFRHVSSTLVNNMKQRQTFEIYYSSKRKVALFKIQIPLGTLADINPQFKRINPPYELTNYNVGGATLFILYDFGKAQIFHAHLRLGSRYLDADTEVMRKANNLTWRVKPFPIQNDLKYENTVSSALFEGNQLD